jgi:Mg2+ and Co2+ transporter CorA
MLTPSKNGASTAEMEESSHHSKDNQCCWLDVTCPTVADIEQLSRKLGLHALTTEDILGKETQEKLEIHPNVG